MWSIQNVGRTIGFDALDYNILNIVVNTEQKARVGDLIDNYNILNIVVNTELTALLLEIIDYYNILNIVVNTELMWEPY